MNDENIDPSEEIYKQERSKDCIKVVDDGNDIVKVTEGIQDLSTGDKEKKSKKKHHRKKHNNKQLKREEEEVENKKRQPLGEASGQKQANRQGEKGSHKVNGNKGGKKYRKGWIPEPRYWGYYPPPGGKKPQEGRNTGYYGYYGPNPFSQKQKSRSRRYKKRGGVQTGRTEQAGKPEELKEPRKPDDSKESKEPGKPDDSKESKEPGKPDDSKEPQRTPVPVPKPLS
ncbi:hypothetical protein FOA43_002253 [Brettanomyces nanus]|uniref:Uncharacterized protein n=1 Tax=Eeniella nana TaxID=13502 RepID=A0A875S3G6_EENNA|nr:uncharacterized protein FOA43_002253 [Brettanomyces nanus]QPG74915.1 hypothetical protein FOA43_002253 [Brettanomyces nanus]